MTSKKSPGPEAGRLSGCASGCPFCLARTEPQSLAIGDRVRLLADFRAGAIGTVVSLDDPIWPGRDRIVVTMDGDPAGVTCSVILSHYLPERLPEPPMPSWALPVELRFAEQIDAKIVRFCENNIWKRGHKPNLIGFFEVIRYIWWHRLPIEPFELAAALTAHGLSPTWARELAEFYRFGRDLLMYAVGRKPIKKKRISAQ